MQRNDKYNIYTHNIVTFYKNIFWLAFLRVHERLFLVFCTYIRILHSHLTRSTEVERYMHGLSVIYTYIQDIYTGIYLSISLIVSLWWCFYHHISYDYYQTVWYTHALCWSSRTDTHPRDRKARSSLWWSGCHHPRGNTTPRDCCHGEKSWLGQRLYATSDRLPWKSICCRKNMRRKVQQKRRKTKRCSSPVRKTDW